jgi:hypothetical protein
MKLKIDSIGQKVADAFLSIPSICILNAALGTWLIFDGLSNYHTGTDFENKAISSVGIIKTVVTESPVVSGYSVVAYRKDYESTVQFKTQEGETIKLEGTNLCHQESLYLCSGEEVQILYASNNPQLFMVKGGVSPMDRAKNKIIVGTVMMLLSTTTVFIIERPKNSNK